MFQYPIVILRKKKGREKRSALMNVFVYTVLSPPSPFSNSLQLVALLAKLAIKVYCEQINMRMTNK